MEAEISDVLRRVIRALPVKRLQLTEEMTSRLGQHITVAMLNDWTAPSKRPARFPACFVAAFCEVTGDDSLRLAILSQRQRDLLELGQAVETIIAEHVSELKGRKR